MVVPSPFPYQGSKRKLADTILGYFPQEVDRLIEPFAGAAAVSLAAARHGLARRFWLNDIDAALVGLWNSILEAPECLVREYSDLWHTQLGCRREFYDEVRDRFNVERKPSQFLYLLARCVKASVRYNAEGHFNQSPDNRRKGATPDRLRCRVMTASRLLAGRTQVTNRDYREVLAGAGPQDLVYMDPPYQGVCSGRDPRYRGSVRFGEFAEALNDAVARGISFILSYDGRTGDKQYGKPISGDLGLLHIEVDAGRSSQATLLGRDALTIESLYLSPALVDQLEHRPATPLTIGNLQLSLMG